jgi:hypothetical protein
MGDSDLISISCKENAEKTVLNKRRMYSCPVVLISPDYMDLVQQMTGLLIASNTDELSIVPSNGHEIIHDNHIVVVGKEFEVCIKRLYHQTRRCAQVFNCHVDI